MLGRRLELAALHRDGHELPVELTISAVRAGGDYTFNAFVHDISERRQRERYLAAEHAVTPALLESATVAEARPRVLEALGESLGCAVAGWWEPDATGHVLRCEALWHAPAVDATELLELSEECMFRAGEELPGRVWDSREAHPIDDLAQDASIARLRAAATAGLTSAIGLPLVSDGQVLAVIELFSAQPLRREEESEGAVRGLCARVARYLERDRAAQALHEANYRFATAFGDAATGMALVGAEPDSLGEFLEVNDALCKLTGYPREELLCKRFADITHPDDVEADIANAERLLGGEIDEYHIEKRSVRPDGKLVWILLTSSLVRTAEGRPLYFLSQIVDITERKRAERRLALQGEIARKMAEGVCLVRASDGTIAYVNESWSAMFGYAEGELIGQPVAVVNAPGDLTPEETAKTIMDALRRDGTWTGEVENIRKDGTRFWCEARVSTFEDPEHGTVWVSVYTDVTARRRAEAELRAAEERFRRAFEDAGTGMALVGVQGEPAGRFVEVNDALCEITGYAREQLLTIGFAEITHPDDLPASVEGIRGLMAGELSSYQAEQRIIDAAREVVWVLVTTSVVRDADGRPLHRIAQLQDVTERKRFEGQLQYLADHDPVTGLFNRRRFEEELARELSAARRYGTGGAVLALDLDNFKYVNDTLGHAAGDELIANVAGILRRRLRGSDILARLGGDEFAVMLPHADEQEARLVASELVDAIRAEARVTTEKGSRRTSASIGIALFFETPDQLESEELLVEADIAMYDAKEAGRDRVCVFDPASGRQARMEARMTWTEQIREALEQERFVLHAQPIVPLQGLSPARHELLVRMVGKSGELIPPGTFLYVAERSDLVQEIDRWVVHSAIRLLAEEQRAGHDVCFEVNLSAKSITDPELPAVIARELASTGADPRRLIFEVTETAAIVNVDRAKHFAGRLAELGCGFALDDFGAGFASFYYLKHLAFDYLKIDGEFVAGLAGSRTNQLVVQAVVDIARGLGKQTIAEYVGDEETVDLLRSYGVDYAQGFHIGKPRPIDAVELHRAPASRAPAA